MSHKTFSFPQMAVKILFSERFAFFIVDIKHSYTEYDAAVKEKR